MRAAYLDTSWAVAVAFMESGHESLLQQLGSFDAIYSSNLLEAEFWAAFSRAGRPRDPAFLDGINWVLPARPLTYEITRVLDTGYVKGADLWHLSCALFVARHPASYAFLTLDRAQAEVARKLGFQE